MKEKDTKEMKESKELTIINPKEMTEDQINLIKRTIAAGASNDELSMFIAICNKTQLDPFARQIYMIKRQGKQTIQASIDGLRLVAQRSGEYTGQLGPFWCGKDGVWKDIWTDDAPPFAAKVGIMRRGFIEPVWAVAKYKEYAPEGAQAFMWTKMPSTMIAKCAEALGLRKAFPQELSGIYSSEEISNELEQEEPPKATFKIESETIIEQPKSIKTEKPVKPIPAKEPNNSEDLKLKAEVVEDGEKSNLTEAETMHTDLCMWQTKGLIPTIMKQYGNNDMRKNAANIITFLERPNPEGNTEKWEKAKEIYAAIKIAVEQDIF